MMKHILSKVLAILLTFNHLLIRFLDVVQEIRMQQSIVLISLFSYISPWPINLLVLATVYSNDSV